MSQLKEDMHKRSIKGASFSLTVKTAEFSNLTHGPHISSLSLGIILDVGCYILDARYDIFNVEYFVLGSRCCM